MRSPKYFIAVVPRGLAENSELKILLAKMKRTLKERDRGARWMPPDMWHLTLEFLGSLSGDQLAQVGSALSGWTPSLKAMKLEIHGVGAFPNPHEARVLWLGVRHSAELRTLQRDLRSHLALNGIHVVDERAFVPHVTLARFRNLQSLSDLVNLGGRKSFGRYDVTDAVLFQSVLQGAVAKYIPLARVNINGSGSAQPK